MFNHIDDKINSELENKQQTSIDLLPEAIKKNKNRRFKEEKSRADKINLHIPQKKKPLAHKAEIKLVSPKKPKKRGFNFNKFFSVFNNKKKKQTLSPILSMNVVSAGAKAQTGLTPEKDRPKNEGKLHQPEKQPEKQPERHTFYRAGDDFAQLGVNLLPTRKRKLTDRQIVTGYILIIIIGILIIVSPFVYLTGKTKYYQNENALIKKQIYAVTQKNKQLQEEIKQFGTLSYKLKYLLTLFNQHIYWSKFFPTLEKNTVKNVYFTSLDVGNNYTISLQGNALTLRDAAEQLVVFQNNQRYLDTQLVNLSLVEPKEKESDQATIDFIISFTLSPDVVHQ